ncbi:MAG: YebC/PmpR family DNA-binding transcriptional regulator [Eubacteriales bacterium]|nr:YebC/PmpR family DNA-binding transcriptional regulator [Eubacteriales bacterium]
MSGHNKWSTIKHKKEKTDAQRGKIFTKIGREIAIAVREGGSADPNTNSKLKDVVAKAKAANMPNENIMRSIKKAAGEGEGANYKEITYEGYAPGGVAVIVEVVTDNLNRTASEVRHIFDKCGGSLGATGCVSWKFERKGVIEIDNNKGLDEDEMMMLALDAGASDVEYGQEVSVIYTDPNDFSAVRDSLEASGCTFLSAERAMVPTTTVEITDPEMAGKVQKLIDWLEDYDDTQEVFHDADLPEEEEEDD